MTQIPNTRKPLFRRAERRGIRLRFVQAWVDPDGRAHHYFRRAGYPRTRLPGLPGSAEFMDAYQRALDSAMTDIGADQRSKPGSVSAAIASYYTSPAFKALAPSTQVVCSWKPSGASMATSSSRRCRGSSSPPCSIR